jgi:hypothetical protein
MRRIECALEELKFKNPVLEELKTIENLKYPKIIWEKSHL